MSSALLLSLAVLLSTAPPPPAAAPAAAPEPAPVDKATQVRMVRNLLKTINQCDVHVPPDVIDCRQAEFAAEFTRQGLRVNTGARVAWASDEAAIKALGKGRKLIICPDAQGLACGASVAIVQVKGGFKTMYNMATLAATGITFPKAENPVRILPSRK